MTDTAETAEQPGAAARYLRDALTGPAEILPAAASSFAGRTALVTPTRSMTEPPT